MHGEWWQKWESDVQVLHLLPSSTKEQRQSFPQMVLRRTIGLDANRDELLLYYPAESPAGCS